MIFSVQTFFGISFAVATISIWLLCFTNIYLIMGKCEKCPIDFEMKIMDQCYLTVQNIIKYDVSNESKTKVSSFIYSATKPFLIELINNATNDCICSQNLYNEHLKDF